MNSAEKQRPEGISVPDRLVDAATQMFGELGTHAVSLREIQRRAGVLNEAAVRYYFKNRPGLLDACLARVAEQFSPLFDEAWAELIEFRASKQLSPSHVVTAVVASFYMLWAQQKPGVQLVARMIREEGADGQDMLLKHFGHVIWKVEAELLVLLPEKAPTAVRLHSFLAINNIVNGMVDQTLLWRLPAIQKPGQFYSLEPDQLAQGFIDYVTAGVCSASNLDTAK